ncbi:hypothetical protein DFH27DRAFT_250752 [Peziza echinospora]|nr:hypothetical protein DFH27DRAFT_250752 [Peziza echinospora]
MSSPPTLFRDAPTDNSYVMDEPAGASEQKGTGPNRGPSPASASTNPVVRDEVADKELGSMKGMGDSATVLEKDEKEAMNPQNILKGQPRTRFGGRKPGNVNYKEPGDEEGLPGPDDGTSYVRTGKTEIVMDDS